MHHPPVPVLSKRIHREPASETFSSWSKFDHSGRRLFDARSQVAVHKWVVQYKYG